MTALAVLGEDDDSGSVWEKVMWSLFGILNLRPEEYTGTHGFRVTLLKIRY